tara:strand:+ start:41236 stop:42702 length:1467 start_codon:yes stop_codon:yes gene_type:complete
MSIRAPVSALGKSTIIYGLGSISAKIAAFLLIPVYTKFLSTEIVGTIALIELFETFLIGIGQMGITQAVWTYIPREEYSKQREIIFSGFLGVIIINAIFLSIFLIWSSAFSKLFGLDTDNSYLFFFVIINILLQFGSVFQLSILQYQNRPISYLILSIAQLFGILILSSIFIISFKLGLFGALVAKMLVMSISFIYCSYSISKNYISYPSMKVFIRLLKFGFPLVILGLSGPILRLSDRFILNMFVPLSEIGIFSINYKFGMLLNMFLVAPMLKGLLPMIYKNSLNKDLYPVYKDIMYYYCVIGCFFVLGITFFISPVIEFVSSSEYLKMTFIVPIISLAYLLSGFRAFFMPMIAGANKTDIIGKWTLYGVIISIILNYLLIAQFGIIGAAISTLICYFIFSLISYLISQSILRLEWELLRILKLLFLTTLISLAFYGLTMILNYDETYSGLILITTFPILLWLFKIISDREINGIISIFSSTKNQIK